MQFEILGTRKALLRGKAAFRVSRSRETKENLLGIVDPEEVRIQHRLHQPSDPADRIRACLRDEVAVEPIRNVQRSICAKRKEIVRRDGVGLAGALQHEELRQDGDGLEPDREGPENLY